LEDAADLSLLESSLENGADPSIDYLESPDASVAVAAAEVVVALDGKPSSDLPAEAKDWIEDRGAPSSELKNTAQMAVSRVREDSELRDLWEEAGDLEGWISKIDDLVSRLQ
jgi:hypothetical protein